MKFFFLCRTGHHTSLLAAGLYLKFVETKTSSEEVSKLPGYNEIEFADIGTPFFVGRDHHNNEVYTIGVSTKPELLSRVVGDLLNLLNKNPADWQVVNFYDCVTPFTRIGIWLKRFKLNHLAILMFRAGMRKELELLSNKLERCIKPLYPESA